MPRKYYAVYSTSRRDEVSYETFLELHSNPYVTLLIQDGVHGEHLIVTKVTEETEDEGFHDDQRAA